MARSMVVSRIVFDRLPELRGQIRERAGQLVKKTAHDIEAHAKQTVPVDTGNLKNSIQAEMESDLTAVVSVGADYGIYVEMGTHKMAARPFMVPAAEAVKPGFEAAMKKIVE